MRRNTIVTGRRAASPTRGQTGAADVDRTVFFDERRLVRISALTALCAAVVCVSFLALSVQRTDSAAENAASSHGGAEFGEIAVFAPSGDDAGEGERVPVSGDGSIWSYIEGVLRRLMNDDG